MPRVETAGTSLFHPDKVVVENKAVAALTSNDEAQLLTHLRITVAEERHRQESPVSSSVLTPCLSVLRGYRPLSPARCDFSIRPLPYVNRP